MIRQPFPDGSLIPRIGAALRALVARGDCALVAVSGGADSSCLLHCLQALRGDLGIDVHVAHVHHGLRGAAADEDARFVASQAARYGLPFTLLRVDVAALRRRESRSVQDAARAARYTALRGLRAQIGAAVIATGHTADDQAETLLLHLLRGSGIDGLAGMRGRQGDLLRPLLHVSHAAVLHHCRAHDLAWREDASNSSRAYRRNAIRLDLLPALEAYNPRIREALARCAGLLALDADYLREQAERRLETLLLPGGAGAMGDGFALDRAAFVCLPEAMRLHVVRAALARLLGDTARFTAAHVQAIDRLACSGHAGQCGHLPRGVRVECAADALRFGMASAAVAPHPGSVPLPAPGAVQFGPWRIEADLVPAESSPPAPRATTPHEVRCSARVAVGLQVRARSPGDRMRPLGLDGARKLQDLFVDRKVPRGERDQVPIVEAADGILWVVGVALAEQARVRPSDSVVLRLRAWRATLQ